MTRRNVWMLLTAMVLLVSTSFAQSPTGTIRGLVTDPSGAVVSKAAIKITDLATQRTLNTQTNDAGLFTVPLLLPGEYTVTVTAQGFAKIENKVVVQAGQTIEANAKLQVGTPETVVQVEAAGAMVMPDTSRSTIDGVITGKQIDTLPLDARNFLELAALEPSVYIRDGGDIDPTKTGAYRTVGVLGKSGTSTRVQVDGIDITDETVGTTMANISDDAVQEFQLSRSSQDLSTSLTTAGAVSIISRSGENTIHGSAFEYYRNQEMGARPQFSQELQPFHRHQVGFRVGGPFKKDKLFWFLNWERTYQTEVLEPYTTDDRIPDTAGHNCVLGCFGSSPLGIRMASGRLDWNFSDTGRLFYRFGHSWDLSTGGSIPASPFSNLDWTNSHVAGVDLNKGGLSHSFRFGYVNFNNQINSTPFAGWEFPQVQGYDYYLAVGNYAFGPNSLAPQATYQDNFQGKYDGTWMHGKHLVRFGMEFNHIVLGGFANFAGPLTINGDGTEAAHSALVAAHDANPLATNDPTNPYNYNLSYFSTGPDNGFFTADGCHGFKYGCHKNNRIAWYVGDNWRAAKNLTLNFGTRWEYDSGYFNDETKITRPSYLDYWMKGASQHPTMGKNKFGPQFGFAWDPKNNGKTVIRGGGYMAYEMNIYNNLMFDQAALLPAGIGPDFYDSTWVAQPNGDPITPAIAGINVASLPASCQTASAIAAMNEGTYTCMYGNPISQTLDTIGLLNVAVKNSYASYAFNPSSGDPLFFTSRGLHNGYLVGGSAFKVPYAIQVNFGFQREIKPGHLLSVDFLFNHGVHQGFLGQDMECRQCAVGGRLNVSVAQTRIANTLAAAQAYVDGDGVPHPLTDLNGDGRITVADYVMWPYRGTITAFGFGGDGVFTGRTPDPNATAYPLLQTTNFTRARIMGDGGFTKYRGLQVTMKGRLRDKTQFLKNATYQVSWAYGLSEGTGGSTRTEFLNGPTNKLNPTDPRFFGPSTLDFRHMVSGAIVLDTFLGLRLAPMVSFHTAPPGTLTLPAPSGTPSSTHGGMFTQDYLGVGVNGYVLPGTTQGQLNRGLNDWFDVNLAIANYNALNAGKLTPAGQALVDAGLFTTSQLVTLKAVMPSLKQVPTANPWPFESYFRTDLALSRPFKLAKVREGLEVIPMIQFFNVFNYTSLGTYGGLGGSINALNYDYAANGKLGYLETYRGRQGGVHSTRLFQFGVRANF